MVGEVMSVNGRHGSSEVLRNRKCFYLKTSFSSSGFRHLVKFPGGMSKTK